MLLQSIKKRRGEYEVVLTKLARLFGLVYSCQVEYKVAVSAELLKLLQRVVLIVFVYLFYRDVRSRPVLLISNVF